MAIRQAAEEANLREELVKMEEAVKQAKARECGTMSTNFKLAGLLFLLFECCSLLCFDLAPHPAGM